MQYSDAADLNPACEGDHAKDNPCTKVCYSDQQPFCKNAINRSFLGVHQNGATPTGRPC